jgi:hypothetical protein
MVIVGIRPQLSVLLSPFVYHYWGSIGYGCGLSVLSFTVALSCERPINIKTFKWLVFAGISLGLGFAIYLFIPARVPQVIGPPPYGPSQYQISFDRTSVVRLAPGSDNWAVTWAGDNHQYAPWGDGGGFNGTNVIGRDSLGVARIEGGVDDYKGFNVWGGYGAENRSNIDGKSYGLLSVDGVLYMWVSPGSNIENFEEARLYRSSDHAKTWVREEWAFSKDDGIISPTFTQFGQDYHGARDDFVYVYAPRLKDARSITIQRPGQIDLLRVPRQSITDRSKYQFFFGIDENGSPRWTADLSQRLPVYEDANGSGWSVSVSYNSGLGRYFLITEHTESLYGNMGIFEATEPWGPWRTVVYSANLGGVGTTFFWNFSNKWISNSGRDFVLIFTGVKSNDAWGAIKGSIADR